MQESSAGELLPQGWNVLPSVPAATSTEKATIVTGRDIEAERAVLSDLLLDSSQADAVRRIVGVDAFTSTAHRDIFAAILELVALPG